MLKYLITEAELKGIVEFAQNHPRDEFYAEAMQDGNDIEDEFLSCGFWRNLDSMNSGFWELAYGCGEYDKEEADYE